MLETIARRFFPLSHAIIACAAYVRSNNRLESGRRLFCHARAQTIRSGIIRRTPHEPAQPLSLDDPMPTELAPAEMIADGYSGLGIELPIDIGIQGPKNVPAAHRSVAIGAASCSTTINRSRA